LPHNHDGPHNHDLLRNRDVDWDLWPVQTYLAENYRRPHPADLAVMAHHAEFYRRLPADSIGVSVEFGAGPNLYPLMLASAVSRRIQAFEPSAASVAYLGTQLGHGPDSSWDPFYAECRRLLPRLPPSAHDALSKVEILRGDAAAVTADTYDLASMHFVAESVTEHAGEFDRLCRTFAGSVRPGGYLVAAFMENMGRYQLGDGSSWPGYRVDAAGVAAVFAPHTTGLEVTRIDADESLPEYGYTGMVLMTARRHTPPGS